MPAIRKMAASSPRALGRVQAMWTLEGLGALDRATVMAGLSDKEPVVRASALRLSERLFKQTAGRAELLTRIRALIQDPSAEVQLQAVLTLGEAKDPGQDIALAQAVRAQTGTRFMRDAFYSGLAGRELSLIERLSQRCVVACRRRGGQRRRLRSRARRVGRSRRGGDPEIDRAGRGAAGSGWFAERGASSTGSWPRPPARARRAGRCSSRRSPMAGARC